MTQNEKNKECVKVTNVVKDLLGISEFSAKTEWYGKKKQNGSCNSGYILQADRKHTDTRKVCGSCSDVFKKKNQGY